jgi:hypothetical protein
LAGSWALAVVLFAIAQPITAVCLVPAAIGWLYSASNPHGTKH